MSFLFCLLCIVNLIIWCKNGYIQIDKNIFINPAWDRWMLLIASHVSCIKGRKELDLGSGHVNSRVSLLFSSFVSLSETFNDFRQKGMVRCMDGRLPKEWKGSCKWSRKYLQYRGDNISFFFFLFQYFCVEPTTDSFNQW